MSNANYSASVITQRRQNKAIAGSFINRIQNASQSTTSYGPIPGNFDQSVVQAVTSGQQTQYRRSEENCVVVDPGCPCGVASISSPIIGCGDVNFNSYWAANISGAGGQTTNATAVSACGNVYVVGNYNTVATFVSFSLPQPSSGNPVNTTPFGTITNPSPLSGPNPTYEGTYLAKYDVNGVVQWVTAIGVLSTASGSGSTIGYSIAVDVNENVYVTGTHGSNSNEGLTLYNYTGVSGGVIQYAPAATLAYGSVVNGYAFLVKYNTSGIAQWATKLDSQVASTINQGTAVTVDANSNVYLTGFFGQQSATAGATLDIYRVQTAPVSVVLYGSLQNTLGGKQAAFVVKYDTNGQTLWATSILTDQSPLAPITVQGNGITVDPSGNVYVIGGYKLQSGPIVNYNVIFNSYQSPPSPTNIGVNLFGTINTSSSQLGDIFLVKYNTSGVIQWVTNITGTGDDGDSLAIAVDTSGSVYVTGMFQSTISLNTFGAAGTPMTLNSYGTLSVSGTQDVFVAKYSTTGQSILWATRVGGVNNERGTGIAVDGNGNTYVCGYITPSATQQLVTFFSFGSPPGVPGGLINLNPNNTIDISQPNQPPEGQSGVVIKYNSVGVVQWVATQTSNVGTTSSVQPTSIALDPNGNIHVAGWYQDNILVINNYRNVPPSPLPMVQTAYGTLPAPTSRDSFLVKYNPSGQVV